MPALPVQDIFHELCFIIPGERVPALNFQAALRDSLKDVTLRADMFVPAISEAWETFKSKKRGEL